MKFTIYLLIFLIFPGCKKNDMDMKSEFIKGISLYSQNRRGLSLKIFEKILEKDPSHIDSLIMIGRIYYANKDFPKALEYLQRAYSIDDRNINVLLWLAKVYALNKKKNKKALEYLDKILKSSGDHIEARYTKALVLVQNKKMSQALIELKVITQQEKKLAFVHLQIGLIYWQAHQIKKAKKEFERAVLLSPKYLSMDTLIKKVKEKYPLKKIAAKK